MEMRLQPSQSRSRLRPVDQSEDKHDWKQFSGKREANMNLIKISKECIAQLKKKKKKKMNLKVCDQLVNLLK